MQLFYCGDLSGKQQLLKLDLMLQCLYFCERYILEYILWGNKE